MHDRWTLTVENYRWRVFAYRIARRLIQEGKMPPLIEIKGLGAAVTAAKKGIADVRSETAGLSADATAFVTLVQDVRTQIAQAQADLKFEAETLGNGGSANSAPQPQPSAQSSNQTTQQFAAQSAVPLDGQQRPTISPETHTRDSTGQIISK